MGLSPATIKAASSHEISAISMKQISLTIQLNLLYCHECNKDNITKAIRLLAAACPPCACLWCWEAAALLSPGRGVFVNPLSFPGRQILTLCCICLADEFKYQQSFSRLTDTTFRWNLTVLFIFCISSGSHSLSCFMHFVILKPLLGTTGGVLFTL